MLIRRYIVLSLVLIGIIGSPVCCKTSAQDYQDDSSNDHQESNSEYYQKSKLETLKSELETAAQNVPENAGFHKVVKNGFAITVDQQSKSAVVAFEIPTQTQMPQLTEQEIKRAKEMFAVCKIETHGQCKVVTFRYGDEKLLPRNKEQAIFLLYSPYLKAIDAKKTLGIQATQSAKNPLNEAQAAVLYAKTTDNADKNKPTSLRDEMLAKAALYKEGFFGSTMVKTAQGNSKIEDLKVGDLVACYDPAIAKQTYSAVTFADKQHVSKHIQIKINDQIVHVAHGHQFYVETLDALVSAHDLLSNPFLCEVVDSNIQDVQEINQPLDVVRITVDGNHNFYITNHNILVHNYGRVVFELVGTIGTKVIPLVLDAAPKIFGGWLVFKPAKDRQRRNKQIVAVDEFQGWGTPIEANYRKQDGPKIKEKSENSYIPPIVEQVNSITGGGPQMPQDPDKDKDKKKDSGKEAPPISIHEKDGNDKHIFRDKAGHVQDTPENRKLLKDLVSDQQNFLGLDKYGTSWYAKNLPDGTQIWATVRNNNIRNGGINNAPIVFNANTGLCREL